MSAGGGPGSGLAPGHRPARRELMPGARVVTGDVEGDDDV